MIAAQIRKRLGPTPVVHLFVAGASVCAKIHPQARTIRQDPVVVRAGDRRLCRACAAAVRDLDALLHALGSTACTEIGP